MRRWLIVAGLASTLGGSRPAAGQTLEIEPVARRAYVGDPVTLRVIAHLSGGQVLIDPAPRPLVALREGVRLLSADTLRPSHGGTLEGAVEFAFYRPGLQPIPTLALLYRRGAGEPPETLVHAPAAIEIASLLPPGNPPLKDIKPLLGGGGTGPEAVAAILLLATGLAVVRWRRRPSALAAPPPPGAGQGGPFDQALARLDALARGTPEGADVARHFEAVAEVLRDCLEAGAALPANRYSTSETLSALPEDLAAGGARDRLAELLTEADLVKFARLQPRPERVGRSAEDARSLVLAWRDRTGARRNGSDAVR
jgi:hypothetical protein